MRLSISIDDTTYQQLQAQATKDKRSLASLIRLIISQAYKPELNKASLILRERAACKQIVELTGTADTLETIHGPVVYAWGLVWYFSSPETRYSRLRCVYGKPDTWDLLHHTDIFENSEDSARPFFNPLRPPEATP